MSEDLITRLKHGEESAFKELVDENQQRVFTTCFGIVHNETDADDLAQEVFIEAFRSMHKFRADSKLSTWLYRIAINKSLNFKRDNKRLQLFQSIGFAESPEVEDNHEHHLDEPDEALIEKQRAKIIHNAIDSLPKNQKSAFVLSKYDELSYKEISEVMQISISSVESLLFRAKKNLQKKLISCYKKSC